MGGVADRLDGCAAFWMDLNRQEKWANRNILKFSNRKFQVLHLGGNDSRCQYTLGARWLENSLAE